MEQKIQYKLQNILLGGRVKNINIGNLSLSGIDVRQIFSLKSANFNYKIEDDKITFEVVGYGHGVGMSQTGANTLAKNGNTYLEIINHFYKDVNLTKM